MIFLNLADRKFNGIKNSFIALACLYGIVTSAFAEIPGNAPDLKPEASQEQQPKGKNEIIEDSETFECELQGYVDGSALELANRERAADVEKSMEKGGLLKTEEGMKVLDVARAASGCEKPLMGTTVCETLKNHKYANVDDDCRRILLFEEDRYAPITVTAKDGDGVNLSLMIMAIENQIGVAGSYPTLRGGSTSQPIDPRLAISTGNPLADVIVVWTIGKVLDEGLKKIKSDRKDSAAIANGDAVLKENKAAIDRMWDLQSDIRALERSKDRLLTEMWEKAAENHSMAQAGQISTREAETRSIELVKTQENETTKIDDEIDKKNNELKDLKEGVDERSEKAIQELQKVKTEECQAGACEEQKILINIDEYETGLAMCKKRYGFDTTTKGVTLSGMDGKATRPKCSIETFERITSAYTNRVRPSGDEFGREVRPVKSEKDQRTDERAQKEKEARFEQLCGLDATSCECIRLDGEIKSAKLEKFEAGRDPAEVAIELLAKFQAKMPEPAMGTSKPRASDLDVIVADFCDPKPKFVYVRTDKGEYTYELLKPDDQNYPIDREAIVMCKAMMDDAMKRTKPSDLPPFSLPDSSLLTPSNIEDSIVAETINAKRDDLDKIASRLDTCSETKPPVDGLVPELVLPKN
jgi:hypothetical protein